METRHYAREDISEKLSSLGTSWQGLVEASREKALRLQQAYQVQSGGTAVRGGTIISYIVALRNRSLKWARASPRLWDQVV